jgi:hypothetical protein
MSGTLQIRKLVLSSSLNRYWFQRPNMAGSGSAWGASQDVAQKAYKTIARLRLAYEGTHTSRLRTLRGPVRASYRSVEVEDDL